MTTASLPSVLTRSYDLVSIVQLFSEQDSSCKLFAGEKYEQLRIDIGMQIVEYLHQGNWKFDEEENT